MRSIEHPGPVSAERTQCVRTGLRAVDIELPRGESLLSGIAAALSKYDATSAVVLLHSGSLAPMSFVMPATSKSEAHAVYYSERFEANGAARIESGCITVGQRDGTPWLHCHAVWTEADGSRRCGHVLPESQVGDPIQLSAWLLDGADFLVTADDETNFALFQPMSKSTRGEAAATSLAVRVRPNVDFCTALEEICAAHGISHARVRGGVGSLIGAAFDDGRVIEPFITEVFIEQGVIAPAEGGALCADVDIGLVDHTGQMAEGRLRRGHNPVLVTFELIIEPVDAVSLSGQSRRSA